MPVGDYASFWVVDIRVSNDIKLRVYTNLNPDTKNIYSL